MFNKEQKEKMIRKLEDKLNRLIHKIKCPICGDTYFTLADGYIKNVLQDDLTKTSSEGPSIPCVAMICKNCGFISQHAIGMLGLDIKTEGH